MKQKSKKVCIYVIFIGIALWLWIIWGNSALMVQEFTIYSSKIPNNFSGYRIAQISDLHNAEFGKNNQKLVALLQSTNPDMIVITGDLVDSNHTNTAVSLAFAKQATQIAPTYYVTGNHEAAISEYTQLKTGLESLGVTVLENQAVWVEKDTDAIACIGLNDPALATDAIENTLHTLVDAFPPESYKILLSHRPEYFDIYTDAGVDLVFSGHAHGGQFRIPYMGGLIAPGQGLFPQYDSGIYTKENTNMVVSRGLGNSIIPLRIHNRPEIVVVELCTDMQSQNQ